MIEPTLGNGLLYQVNCNRDRLIAQFERRKVFRYCIAIFVCIVIITFCWTIRP